MQRLRRLAVRFRIAWQGYWESRVPLHARILRRL